MKSEQKKRNLQMLWYMTLVVGIAAKSMIDKENEKQQEEREKKKQSKAPAKAKH